MTGIWTSQQQRTWLADFPVAYKNVSIYKSMGPVTSAHHIYVSNFDMPVQQLIHQWKM